MIYSVPVSNCTVGKLSNLRNKWHNGEREEKTGNKESKAKFSEKRRRTWGRRRRAKDGQSPETNNVIGKRKQSTETNDTHVDERFAITLITDFLERNDLLDRRIIFKLVGRTWTDVWALELSVWARRDANFSSTCVERGARRCREKRRDVDREIWFLFLACTHSNPLFSSFSPSRSISIVPLTLILLIRSFSLSSYMHSLVLVLTLSHNTRKMQRITIFFLSPFVYNVESTFRGSFSIFTRAV